MKPNLFIVGAPKCGTTSWYEYLRTHPDVFFSQLKETQFFATDFPKWRAVRSDEDYAWLFRGSGEHRIVADASVRHLFSSVAAKNIRAYNPDAKIVIFLRSQEFYVPSQHNQMLFNGDETIHDFEQAWQLSGRRDASNTAPFCREPKFLDYKAAGRFSEQVERYFEVFPAEQIRVFHFDDWTAQPRSTYLELMRFLGLEDDGRSDFPKANEAKHTRSRWLAELLIRQPGPVNHAVRLTKRVLGNSLSWRLAAGVSRLNSRKGYVGSVSERIRDEIRDYYAADNALLEPRIWRPETPAGENSQAEAKLALHGT